MAVHVLGASILLLVVLALFSLYIMGLFTWKNQFPVEGRTVLLTGASQGLGRAIARLLAQKGANVIIVARDVKKLQAAVEYITAAARDSKTQRFHYISADVTSEAENVQVLAEATTWNNGRVPEIVWANAGVSQPGLFVETSLEAMRKQMDINYWSVAYLAHATLKEWLYPATPHAAPSVGDRPRPELPRHFILTSSSVAFVNIAGYGPYGPPKTALRALADSLRSEVNLYNGARRSDPAKCTQKGTPAPFDIKIHAVMPGTIDSPGLQIENAVKHPVTHLLEESDPCQSEDEVASAAMRGLEAGNYMTSTNWLGKLMRISSLGGSPRDNILVDTVGCWITSIAWLYLVPDMEGKVWGWGKKNGMPELGKPVVGDK